MKLYTLILLLLNTTVFAQNIAFVKTTASILRDKAGGNELMRLPYGTPLKILDFEESWYHVEVTPQITEGYIHKSVIALDTLKLSSLDTQKIKALNLYKSGFEDAYVTFTDHAPDDGYQQNSSFYRKMNEGLERLLYWNSSIATVKENIYLLDVLAERKTIYTNTPLEVFNQLNSYGISPELYNNLEITQAKLREFEKPNIKASLFSEKPKHLFVLDMAENEDEIQIRSIPSRVMLIHLLRLYFLDENPFTISKRQGIFIYSSSKKVDFIVCDESGNSFEKNSGEIIYYPDQWGKIHISNLEKPVKGEHRYIIFSTDTFLNQIENGIKINVTEKNFSGWMKCKVLEFDFNNDGVIDMLRSSEACPDEAGDSNDLVNYFNVNGTWKSTLVTRTWCNP